MSAPPGDLPAAGEKSPGESVEQRRRKGRDDESSPFLQKIFTRVSVDPRPSGVSGWLLSTSTILPFTLWPFISCAASPLAAGGRKHRSCWNGLLMTKSPCTPSGLRKRRRKNSPSASSTCCTSRRSYCFFPLYIEDPPNSFDKKAPCGSLSFASLRRRAARRASMKFSDSEKLYPTAALQK